MATKTDFTDEEWATLQKGVTGAGLLVSVGDRDFTDSFGEASALAKHLGSQRQTGSTPLVRELAHVRGTGFGVTDAFQKVEAETLAALSSAMSTLGTKAPDEVAHYRELVLGTARTVAEAKGGVKPGETAVLQKLEAALGGSGDASP